MLPLGLSYRRALLDAELERLRGVMRGVVIDVGGRRRPRGRFLPPVAQCAQWVVVNLDPAAGVHVLGDAEALPVRDGVADLVLCVEVLQYVARPELAVREMARVLAPGGVVVLSAPWLHRADSPTDRHRFTEARLRELMAAAGLRVERVTAQGHFFTALANLLRQATAAAPPRPARQAVAALVVPLAGLLSSLDGLAVVRGSGVLTSYTTGYVVLARKAAPA